MISQLLYVRVQRMCTGSLRRCVSVVPLSLKFQNIHRTTPFIISSNTVQLVVRDVMTVESMFSVTYTYQSVS